MRKDSNGNMACRVVGVVSDGMSVQGICMNMGGLIIQVDDRNALL